MAMTPDELREMLLQLSPSELDAFEQRVFSQETGSKVVDTPVSDAIFPTEPSVDVTSGFSSSISNLPKMSQEAIKGGITTANIPFGLGEQFRGAESFLRNIPGTLSTLGTIAGGALDVGAEAFGAQPTERGQMARAAASELWSGTTDQDRKLRDPVTPVANVAAVAAPFAPKGSGAFQAISAAADIPSTAVGVGGRLLRGVGRAVGDMSGNPLKKAARAGQSTARFAGEMASEIPGFTTGKGGAGVRELAAQGYASDEAAQAAMSAVMDRRFGRDLGEGVIQSVDDLVNDLGSKKRRVLEDNSTLMIDKTDALNAIFGDIDNAGEGGILASKGIRALVERDPNGNILFRTPQGSARVSVKFRALPKRDRKAIESLLNDLGSEDPILTANALDDLKLDIDDIAKGMKSPRGGRIVGEIRKQIRNKLSEVPGYDEAVGNMEEVFRFLDVSERDLKASLRPRGLKKTPNPTQIGRNLQRAYGDNAEEVMDVLNQLSERFPEQGLKGAVAGQQFSSRLPSSIVGRSQGAAIVGSLGAGVGASALGAGVPLSIAASLLSLPFFSPQAVGASAIKLGVGARKAQEIVQRVESAARRADQLGIPTRGMRVGELLERITEEEDQQPSMMSRIGSAANR